MVKAEVGKGIDVVNVDLNKPRIFLKLFDTNFAQFPSTTVEMRGLFKALGGYYVAEGRYWVIDDELLSSQDVLHLRWLVERIKNNNQFVSKLQIEVWVVERNGDKFNATKVREFLSEIERGEYPDGKLVFQASQTES